MQKRDGSHLFFCLLFINKNQSLVVLPDVKHHSLYYYKNTILSDHIVIKRIKRITTKKEFFFRPLIFTQ